ncbi:hypothetical protein [Mesorhizobium sp.]|uniref:hypothetical protein n=1 Tax=Mesorhizobium sp. TaxID=1871066 RepID=UPI000FE6079D|nr:hypothetical protein [Mesorhizobium sp.]RWI92380.1 MAG: hypothetical protein EOR21_17645 [Mesorhizobium sp.]
MGCTSRTKSVWHDGAGAQFPALEVAGKAAALLSQFAGTDQAVLEKTRVDALAAAAGINPKMELPTLVEMLKRRRVIDVGATGDVEVIGLTSSATVQHASDLFEAENPTREERATIALAELTSKAPLEQNITQQLISDEFKITSDRTIDFLKVSENIGFVDAEGSGSSKLYFNGNLFRRDNLSKVKKVIDSLSSTDQAKVIELDGIINRIGCISVEKAEYILGDSLLEKLKAAGMYDINHVANASGEYGFVTKPAAFHKFNDPMADDAFDLAKALVAALTYGMTQSSSGRGKIEFIRLLLNKLNSGKPVGPATAIGEDYRILEMRGVLRVQKASGYGYIMTLLKRDIGEMALAVLTTGETASVNSLNQILPGSMTGYVGPEKSRSDFRRKQAAPSKRMTEDVLQALRQQGGF